MFYCDVGTSWILYHVFPRKTFLFFEIFLQVFDVFSNYGHSPVILFFSNFTFLGCFCFWMVEFLDFSPFKFTLSKLCKTYHLILQTEAIQKSTLCIYDYEHPTCYKNTFPRYKNSRTKVSLCLFHRFTRKCHTIFTSAKGDFNQGAEFWKNNL